MTVVHAIGAAWGALAALPLVRMTQRAAVRQRWPELQSGGRARLAGRTASKLVACASALARKAASTPGSVRHPWAGLMPGTGGEREARSAPASVRQPAWWAPGAARQLFLTLRDRRRRARVAQALERELPVVLDLLAVAVDAGCTPYLAVETASQWSPPVTGAHLARVVGACQLGETFAGALDAAARQEPRLVPLTAALFASERLGAPVGPALGRLADEERAALRRRAEAHARRVPVRLLFPLVFLVLPAFGLLTVAPAVLAGLSRL
jgi:hypothetical protein